MLTYLKSSYAALFSAACISVLSTSTAGANSALEFNGTSDFVALTTTSVTNMVNGYTLEAWANSTTSTLAHRILSNYQELPNRGWGFGVRNTNWRHTTFGIKDYDTANGTMTTGTWTHIAMTLDASNTATFYKNGVFLAAVTHAVPGLESTHTLYIGRRPAGGAEFWQGAIDEIRVWNRVLSAEEIGNRWNRTVAGTEPGLVAYYPFDEGSGTTTEDKSAGAGDGTLNGCTWINSGPTLLAPYTAADQGWSKLP